MELTWIDGTDGREYLIDGEGRVLEMNRPEPWDEHDEAVALAEIYAEFGSSWVFGGGDVADVNAAFWTVGPGARFAEADELAEERAAVVGEGF